MWSMTDFEEKATRMVEERWGGLLAEVDAGTVAREATGEPVPARFFGAAGDTGLQALTLPRRVGGEDLDPVQWTLVLEQIGYLCRDGGFPLVLGIRAVIAEALLRAGTPGCLEEYVGPIARGTLGVALAYSEDADAFSMATTLRRSAGGYVLSGHKDFVTGGLHADVFLTYARSDGGHAACLVHRDDPGVTVSPVDPVGTRTSGPAALDLCEVRLPEERIITAADGLSHAQLVLNARRLIVCAAPLGRARALVELTTTRLNATVRHGTPLSELPNVQAALGRMYIAVEAARALLYRAARRKADGHADLLFDPAISAAKHFVAAQVRSVLEEAMHVLGGHFYYGDPYYGTCLRDFTSLVAVAGTQNLLEINLGSLLRAHTTPADRRDIRP